MLSRVPFIIYQYYCLLLLIIIIIIIIISVKHTVLTSPLFKL